MKSSRSPTAGLRLGKGFQNVGRKIEGWLSKAQVAFVWIPPLGLSPRLPHFIICSCGATQSAPVSPLVPSVDAFRAVDPTPTPHPHPLGDFASHPTQTQGEEVKMLWRRVSGGLSMAQTAGRRRVIAAHARVM